MTRFLLSKQYIIVSLENVPWKVWLTTVNYFSLSVMLIESMFWSKWLHVEQDDNEMAMFFIAI